MRRVEADELWSLFDPDEVPAPARPVGRRVRRGLPGGRGGRPLRAPGQGPRPVRPDDAHAGADRQRLDDLQGRQQRQVQPDRRGGDMVHLSNLCTEITEVTNDAETAVCNLGSINLAKHRPRARAAAASSTGPRSADRAHRGAVPRPGHRPELLPQRAGRGVQPGLAAGRPRRDGPAGRLLRAAAAVRLARGAELSARISEEIYLTALEASAELAEEHGPHAAFAETRAARGELQPDLWDVEVTQRGPLGNAAHAGQRRPGCATRC